MSMTDPIADMLTRIRNAQLAKHQQVLIPSSRINYEIAKILSDEGYLGDVEQVGEGLDRKIKISLRYLEGREALITQLKRESKPGRRRYVKADEIPKPLGGLGLTVLSTSRGLMTGRDARRQKIGGELLCSVY